MPAMPKRVLVVDDEPNIVMSLRFLMEREGYDVVVAPTGRAALDALDQGPADLVLLDVMMPELDGFEVCQRIRDNPDWKETRIVMLTAKGRDIERDKGIALGADAYVTKPFSTRELLARVRAVVRRTQSADSGDAHEVGPLRVDPTTNRVTANGTTVDLSPTEFRLLHFFITHPERVYSRSQLLDGVWGTNAYIEERTVDVHIRRLRKLLAPHACDGYIQTVRSVGYRFSTQLD